MSQGNDWSGVVEAVRRAATARGRSGSGYFSVEGIRLLERALRAGWHVDTAVLSRSFPDDSSARKQALIQGLEGSGCRLVPVPDEVIVELTDGRGLGAIIGLLRTPESPELKDIVAAKADEQAVLLVAVDIKDPGNTGALMRTALAAGADAFVACGISDPYHPKAVRTSMGSFFKLPVLTAKSTEELLAKLKELDIQSVGLAVEGVVSLPLADFSEKGVALLMGSESWGLAPETQQALDRLVFIPMREGVDSYSVNAAAAIALYELGRRQGLEIRGGEPSE